MLACEETEDGTCGLDSGECPEDSDLLPINTEDIRFYKDIPNNTTAIVWQSK